MAKWGRLLASSRQQFYRGVGPRHPCRYLQRPPLAAHGPAGSHGAWRMAHGTWHMEKALSAPLTGHRPGRAKAVRVVRQLVWVEDRVTSGRGHLQQLATRCRSYGFPQTCRRRFDQKGGKGAPVGVRFRRIVSVGVLKMCQFELTSNSSEGGHDVSEGDEARGSVGGCA